ncbi:MAG: M48 family metalloprotease [Pseudomonadota bacterium]
MKGHSRDGLSRQDITRREFLWLTALSSAGFMAGCAVNPVTGKSQLMFVSEDQEIAIDKGNSPHQFSSDYGPVQDPELNQYIDNTGKMIAGHTHRFHMPYSFRAVNATYVNAYAFPGGSIACTRGILLELENEAELAALLGHELGHVNARHTAQQMSKGSITSLILSGVGAYAEKGGSGLGDLATGLGNFAAGALLARYSRDNEREADSLGMKYMVQSRYSPEGMVGLMDILRSMSKHKPNAIEMMFATHPMSDERYQTVVNATADKYQTTKDYPLHRERYMDHTAGLRAKKGAIEEIQNGEKAMGQKKFSDAEAHFQKALKLAPTDYAGLVMMSQCMLAQQKFTAAERYAEKAQKVYPQEAQAYQISGISRIMQKDFSGAYEEFTLYEKQLPGNPGTIFFKGYSLEGMEKKEGAATEYSRYLRIVNQGDMAEYAYQRLVQWGYVRPHQ